MSIGFDNGACRFADSVHRYGDIAAIVRERIFGPVTIQLLRNSEGRSHSPALTYRRFAAAAGHRSGPEPRAS